MPHVHHAASGSCEFLVSLAIVGIALVYLRGWVRLRSIPSSIPSSTPTNAPAAWRAWSLLVGLFLVWMAIASPVATLDAQLLTVHMVQHLLLMTLAPPLIWLSAPVTPLIYGLPGQFVPRILGPLLGWPSIQNLGKSLANPVFCWLAASAALVGWHIPPAFALGMQSAVWHMVEHASFLAAGLLFWWPVIQPWPRFSRGPDLSVILYLFLATLPCDILSGFLVFCDRVVYPAYFSSSHLFGLSALGDQQCAGALMWTCVTVVYFVAGAILTIQLLSPRSAREAEWEPAAYPLSNLGGFPGMATEPILAGLDVPVVGPRRLSVPNVWADYWALTKPEVNFLIVVTTFAGFYMGLSGRVVNFPWWRMIHTLLGTLLVASGTGTLNQYIERTFDAQMRRTARRPLAAGRRKPSAVLWFGIALSAVGGIYLAVAANVLASLLAIATLLSYLFLYTPLKRRTAWCVLVGAIPGAAPPLIGWAAASGKLSFEVWILDRKSVV